MVIMVIVLVVKATILCFGVLLPPLVQLLTDDAESELSLDMNVKTSLNDGSELHYWGGF